MNKFKIAGAAAPLPRTYWVVEKLFLAGAYAGKENPEAHRARLTGLLDAGVRTYINLMEHGETNNSGKPFVSYEETLNSIAADANVKVECLRFPIRDGHIPSASEMRHILDAIDQSMESKRPVYVHCFGGMGRTGTVVSCWLLRHGFASKENVFELLRQLRQADTERASRQVPETTTQSHFVLGWPESVSSETAKRPADNSRRDWFEKLFGFVEQSPRKVRENLVCHGAHLTSRVNGVTYECGRLEVVSLGDLRRRLKTFNRTDGRFEIAEIVGNARAIHADSSNANSVFQVASQFNLLEMVSPDVSPDEGITRYEYDRTQGPACAIACAAGTVYRNYFVELDGQIGQSKSKQVDCLDDIGEAMGNVGGRLWTMTNGYALPQRDGLQEIASSLRKKTADELDSLREKLKIGVQWNTQVTVDGCRHLVTQAYCSALPVAYSNLRTDDWEPFARLILESAYEATFAVAALNAVATGCRTLFLTLLGGGAFGNESEWIYDAIRRACAIYRHHAMDVKIVSYQASSPALRQLVGDIRAARYDEKRL